MRNKTRRKETRNIAQQATFCGCCSARHRTERKLFPIFQIKWNNKKTPIYTHIHTHTQTPIVHRIASGHTLLVVVFFSPMAQLTTATEKSVVSIDSTIIHPLPCDQLAPVGPVQCGSGSGAATGKFFDQVFISKKRGGGRA